MKLASHTQVCQLQYTDVLFYHFRKVRFAYDLYAESLGFG